MREFPVTTVVAAYHASNAEGDRHHITTPKLTNMVCEFLSYMTGETVTRETMIEASAKAKKSLDTQYPSFQGKPGIWYASSQAERNRQSMCRSFGVAATRSDDRRIDMEIFMYGQNQEDYFRTRMLPVKSIAQCPVPAAVMAVAQTMYAGPRIRGH